MVILLLLWRAEGYHQSAVGHLSPFIHECRTYYLNSRLSDTFSPTLWSQVSGGLERAWEAVSRKREVSSTIDGDKANKWVMEFTVRLINLGWWQLWALWCAFIQNSYWQTEHSLILIKS